MSSTIQQKLPVSRCLFRNLIQAIERWWTSIQSMLLTLDKVRARFFLFVKKRFSLQFIICIYMTYICWTKLMKNNKFDFWYLFVQITNLKKISKVKFIWNLNLRCIINTTIFSMLYIRLKWIIHIIIVLFPVLQFRLIFFYF